jgi:tRNA 2-thiouridine synthesizing protein E
MNVDWTPEQAETIARHEGIALGEKHWCVITTCREVIARRGRAPSVREICALCAIDAGELESLFPGGAERLLALVAGVPEFERSH